ncbi:biotin--[acetyl-CoA-carboxylase] ligase, partial [bacterium]|nr:biotin--[acetyl-CoA-carboxylase] ligase [candidate division CSSED10-310 bacterium]
MMNVSQTDNSNSASWYHFSEIDSTNRFLMDLDLSSCHDGTTCTAVRQTHGKGRKDRVWISPVGGLYMSVLFRPSIEPHHWKWYSLGSSLAVAESIEKTYGISNIQLKWPNDIICNKKKVAGLLLQSDVNAAKIVIGIGINITIP